MSKIGFIVLDIEFGSSSARPISLVYNLDDESSMERLRDKLISMIKVNNITFNLSYTREIGSSDVG